MTICWKDPFNVAAETDYVVTASKNSLGNFNYKLIFFQCNIYNAFNVYFVAGKLLPLNATVANHQLMLQNASKIRPWPER